MSDYSLSSSSSSSLSSLHSLSPRQVTSTRRNDVSRKITSQRQKTSARQPMTTSQPKRTTSRQSNASNESRQITSPQSMTSSSLSLATTCSESHASNDFEPLFGRHWEDESEMDRSLKILKQKHAATIRVRKMNDIHNRLLEGKIRLLRNSYSHELKELTRETRCLQDEFSDLEPVPTLKLPRIASTTTVESRSSSALSGKSRGVSVSSHDTVCQTCLFDPDNTTMRCRHFPCFLPKTYNSIGFMPKPQTYSVVGNYKQLMSRCTDLRPPTSVSRQVKPIERSEAEVDNESHAPRTTIKEKIRGLKQLVKEMKERNEKTKPRDWAVNYGDPMPRRILLKPVKSVC